MTGIGEPFAANSEKRGISSFGKPEDKKATPAWSCSSLPCEAILEFSREGILLLDLAWCCTYLNAQQAKFFGVSQPAVLGQSFWQLVPQFKGTDIERQFRQAVIEQTSVQIEIFSSNQGRWFEHRLQPTQESIIIFTTDITDRKIAQQDCDLLRQQLEIQQTHFSAVLRQMPAGVMIADAATSTLISVNQQVEEILGYSYPVSCRLEGADLEQSLRGFYPDGQPYHLDELPLLRSLRTGEVITNEVIELQQKNGNPIFVEASSSPILDNEGKIIAAAVIFQNITERKLAEDELRRSEARFRRLVEANMFGVAIGDYTGRMLYANNALLNMIGYSLEELAAGKIRWIDLTPPEYLDLDWQAGDELRQQGTCKPFRKEYIHKDGHRVPILIGSSLMDEPYNEQEQVISFYFDLTQLDRAEQALRETSQRLTSHMETTPLAVVEWDRELRVRRWSSAAERLFGWQPEEVLGRRIDELNLVYQADSAAVTEICQRILSGNEPQITSYNRNLTKDGNLIYCAWYNSTLTNESGHVTSVLSLVMDMTEQKRAEQALRSSEERLALASQAAKIGTFEWNIQTEEVFWTEEEEALYGMAPGSFGGRFEHWQQQVHPEDRDQAAREMLQAVEHRTDLNTEFRVIWSDGSVHWLSARGRVFCDDRGQPLRMVGVSEDITDRKETEAMLRTRNKRLNLLYETTRDLLSSDQPLGLINNLFQKLQGSIGLDLYLNYIADDDRNQLHLASYSGISNSLAKEFEWLDYGSALCGTCALERCQIVKTDLQQSDDSQSSLIRSLGITAYAAQPLIAHGRLFGTLSFGSRTRNCFSPAETELMQALCDQIAIALERASLMTSLQQQTEQLRQANHIKDEFLAVLSHELRSPLNPIMGWAKLLRTRKFDPEATDRALETIERNAKLQTQLIDDLLDVSRILRGKMALNVCPVRLKSVIHAALETVKLAAEAKGITIQTFFDQSVGQVLGDAGRLQQIVWNLLSNAVKFTPSGGRVEVRLEQVASNSSLKGSLKGSLVRGEVPEYLPTVQPPSSPIHYAQITVTDTGKGINPAFLPHVFEYFRQENGTTTRQFGGLGLGLAIVRHFTELHGGTVHASSLGEDQGATFIVRLPLAEAMPPSQPPDILSIEEMDLNPLRVLVVDDEADMRDLVTIILEQCGAVVASVPSASAALEIFESFKADVLISDIGMPEMDGYMLLQHIRQLPPEQGGQIPAIALTAYAGEVNQKRALENGFQIHLAKPIDPEQLVLALVQFVPVSSERG